VGAPQHGGQEAEGKAVAAREQQPEWELLSTAEAREWELLSKVAKRPREKQVTVREQLSEGEHLDLAAQETNLSGLQKTSMMRGAWETNMPERETAVTRRGKEPLNSPAQEGRQNGAAAEQQRTAANECDKEVADLQARLAAAEQQPAAMVARTEPLVPAQAPPAPTKVPQVPTEASQNPAVNLLISTTAHAGRQGEAAGLMAIIGALCAAQVIEEEKWRGHALEASTASRTAHSSARWT